MKKFLKIKNNDNKNYYLNIDNITLIEDLGDKLKFHFTSNENFHCLEVDMDIKELRGELSSQNLSSVFF